LTGEVRQSKQPAFSSKKGFSAKVDFLINRFILVSVTMPKRRRKVVVAMKRDSNRAAKKGFSLQ